MFIYFLLIIITYLFAYFIIPVNQPDYKDTKIKLKGKIGKSRFLKALCFIFPFLVSAVRYDVGTDFLWTYYKGFERILSGSNVDNFEIGYKYLIRGLGKIVDWPQILIFFSSLVFVGMVWLSVYEQSVDIGLSILLVFITRYYFISMNIIRQFMGLAIIIYSLKYLYKGEKIKYVIFNIIAVSLHGALVICFVFLIVDKFDFSKKKFIILIVISVIVFGVSHTNIIYSIANRVLANTKFLRHLSNSNLYVGEKFALFTFSCNLLILIIMYFAGKSQKNDRRYQIYFGIQILAFLSCVLINAIPLMERIYWMFGFFQILSVPYMIGMYPKKRNRLLLKLFVCGILTVYCIYDIFVLGDQGVIPYRTFWN